MELVQSGSMEEAKKQYVSVAGLLDRAVSKGVLHGNTADRKKHRLHKILTSSETQ
jgi:small subunit ribosomal protein S20